MTPLLALPRRATGLVRLRRALDPCLAFAQRLDRLAYADTVSPDSDRLLVASDLSPFRREE